MWQLNADDFLGIVPKGSHGRSKKAHEKKIPMLGSLPLRALSNNTVGPAPTLDQVTAGAFRAGYPHTFAALVPKKNLNALIRETIQRPFEEVEVRKTDRP